MYNLLDNALKYHHPERPPRVQLTYERQGPYHVTRVQDDCPGFDMTQTTGKLFSMFRGLHIYVEDLVISLSMVKEDGPK